MSASQPIASSLERHSDQIRTFASQQSISTLTTSVPCNECGFLNRRKPGRHCSTCHKFYHLSCVSPKLMKKTSAILSTWKCKNCLGAFTNQDHAIPVHKPLTSSNINDLRRRVTIPVKIPKAARMVAAEALTTVIEDAVNDVGSDPWSRLLTFAPLALGLNPSARKNQSSLVSKTKQAIGAFISGPCLDVQTVGDLDKHQHSNSVNLRKAVNAKLAQGDVSAAVRLVASDDTVLEPTEEVLTALRVKHPPAPSDSGPIPASDFSQQISLSINDVKNALKSFRPSSSGGSDGLRPGHLKDLTADSTAEAGIRLMSAITKLCNRIVSGNISQHARDLLFCANLIALRKKDGGIRPIAVGNTFRRLASKAACRSAISVLASEFAPIQLGVGVKGGCEAAAHSVRSVLSTNHCPSSPFAKRSVIVKLDMKNAFNTIRRDHFLQICQRRAPSLYHLARSAYSTPSELIIGSNTILSESGIQQGDPLGPVLFALGVDDIARSVDTPLNIWYLDDATLGGTHIEVTDNLRRVVPALAKIGLIINPTKSEITNVNCNPQEFDEAVSSVNDILNGVRTTRREDLQILGSPIMDQAIEKDLTTKQNTLESMITRLNLIDAHPALYLLRNCLAIPKFIFTLRSSPCYTSIGSLQLLDDTLRSAAAGICNTSFDDTSWILASLPISAGGLGLRSPLNVADPAYLASLHSNRSLVESILLNINESPLDSTIVQNVARWTECGLVCPSETNRQRYWDNIKSQSIATSLKITLDQHKRACLEAAAQPYSGAWLTALPSSATGNLLDNECLRYAVALRIGGKVCESYRCRCGRRVDELGLHPLSCARSGGRFPRHSALNDIVRRALNIAGYHSILEPVGLDRGDGKRPDGMTVFPFREGKCLVWDATCSDTFSASNAIESAVEPGCAAKRAEDRKTTKYESLQPRFLFTPISVETSGVFGPKTLKFLMDLGQRITQRTGDVRETLWLFERISVAVVRGNYCSLNMACKFDE